MSQTSVTGEDELWIKFKAIKPSSEQTIETKDKILKQINEIRKGNNQPVWDKWTKEEALKKLKEGNKNGYQRRIKTPEEKMADVKSFMLAQLPEALRISEEYFKTNNINADPTQLIITAEGLLKPMATVWSSP